MMLIWQRYSVDGDINMKKEFLVVLFSLVLFNMSTFTVADVLTKEYLTRKFSNMTVKGFHNKRNYAFTRYYYPDGTVIARSEKYGDRVGKWRMEVDSMCESFGGSEKCRMLEEKNGVIYKFSRKNNKIVTYGTFTEGNDLLDHPYVQELAKN